VYLPPMTVHFMPKARCDTEHTPVVATTEAAERIVLASLLCAQLQSGSTACVHTCVCASVHERACRICAFDSTSSMCWFFGAHVTPVGG